MIVTAGKNGVNTNPDIRAVSVVRAFTKYLGKRVKVCWRSLSRALFAQSKGVIQPGATSFDFVTLRSGWWLPFL